MNYQLCMTHDLELGVRKLNPIGLSSMAAGYSYIKKCGEVENERDKRNEGKKRKGNESEEDD